jgi:hypothetical protein
MFGNLFAEAEGDISIIVKRSYSLFISTVFGTLSTVIIMAFVSQIGTSTYSLLPCTVHLFCSFLSLKGAESLELIVTVAERRPTWSTGSRGGGVEPRACEVWEAKLRVYNVGV